MVNGRVIYSRIKDTRYGEVCAERAQLGADVGQWRQHLHVMCVLLKFKCQANALPPALAVVDDHHVWTDRRAVLQHVPDR